MDIVDFTPIRAADAKAKWAIAVSLALKSCKMSREEIARQMGEYLGEKISVDALNAYASQGKDTHIINAVRLEALLRVTDCKDLANTFVDVINCRAVPKDYVPHIEYAAKKIEFKRLKTEIKKIEEALDE